MCLLMCLACGTEAVAIWITKHGGRVIRLFEDNPRPLDVGECVYDLEPCPVLLPLLSGIFLLYNLVVLLKYCEEKVCVLQK